jgi:hypothetical protein
MNYLLVPILFGWAFTSLLTALMFASSLYSDPRPIRGTKLWQTVLLMLTASLLAPLFWVLIAWPDSRKLVDRLTGSNINKGEIK